MKKNKILLLFPDGVGIKNYLYSDVFNNEFHDLLLMSNFNNQTIDYLKKNTKITDFLIAPEYKESIKEKFLRELICLARLKYNANKVNNPSLLSNWNWNQKSISNKIFYKFIENFVWFFKSYSSIQKFENQYQKAIRKNKFYLVIKNILNEIKPQNIFCSHQRGLKMATVFAAAKDLEIKTTTVIYSWDNLPKARLALRADKYLVWSDYMKQEMNLYYPEISQHQVVVTGTPQFEFYYKLEYIIDKEIFYKKYNLDLNKKTICFSGDDEKTSPDDPKYLQDIVSEIINANKQNEFQILLRRCPVDLSGRFDKLINNYPNLIKVANPLWNFNKNDSWSAIYPTLDDVKLLISTVFYSDLVINVGSTMAFDFAMFKKPCIFINYDQINKVDKHWSIKTIYEFQHFRSMKNKNAVIWFNNKEEIIEKIQEALLFKNSQQMIEWKETILFDIENASNNISNNIF